jgi:hypothetical protein
LPLQGQRPK